MIISFNYKLETKKLKLYNYFLTEKKNLHPIFQIYTIVSSARLIFDISQGF